MGKRVPHHETVLQREGKKKLLGPTHGLCDYLCVISGLSALRHVSFSSPNAQVDDFKSFHEHTHSEEEVCEEMDKNAALHKKVKDDWGTRVNTNIL